MSSEHPGPPIRLGPYRLLDQIGAGGMSRVYLAERDDEQFRRKVAIKLIDRGPDAIEIVRRFRTERQILANLEHPHIAHLLDGGETEDARPYFVLEYIDGVAIDIYCWHHRLSLHERLKLFLAVASAVSYAHQNLIVHRDLKPSNILVTADGVPKLLDFGIAKILKPTAELSSAEVTVTGQAPMTPQYASPEQIRGEPITTAADVYGLGLLLYELLSEKRPYRLRGRTLLEVERMVCEMDVAAPSSVTPREAAIRSAELVGDLDAIVLKALAKDPAERYATVQQMVEDLRLFLDGRPLAVARPLTLSYQLGKLLRRHALAAAGSATILAVLIGLLIALSVQSSRLAAERDEAQRARDRAEDVSGFLAETFQQIDPRRGGSRHVTAEEILSLASARLHQELGEQPLTRAQLMTVVGRVYRNLTMFEEAKPLLEEALAIRQAELPDSSPEVAEALYEVALLERKLGDFDRSEKLFKESLRRRQEILGPDHPDTLQTISDMAFLYKHLGKLELARSMLQDVIARREPQGPSRDLTESYIQMAAVLDDLGQFRKAEHYSLKVIEALESANPAPVQDLVANRYNLGLLCISTGRLYKAEEILQETHPKFIDLFGPENYYTGKSFEAMARIYHAEGRLELAKQSLSRGTEIVRKTRGEGSPYLYPFLALAVQLLHDEGRYPEAATPLEEARKICVARLGEEHVCAGETLYLQARLQESDGEFEGALRTYGEALALPSVFQQKEGGSPKVQEVEAAILRAQARLLARQGAAEAAQEKRLQALGIVRRLLDTGSVISRDLYMKLLVDLGRVEEARPYADELWQGGWRDPEFVEIARNVLGVGTDQNLKSSSNRPP